VLVFIGQAVEYVRAASYRKGGRGALGRGDGVGARDAAYHRRRVSASNPSSRTQMTISRRKTIRAVIMRTIIDGTTDMRESPDWMLQPATGLTKAFAGPVAARVLHLQVRQQGGPRRARYDCLSNSSKLRQSLARRVNEWLTWDWANTARPGSRRGRRGEG
jgi:hypothetical protein